MSRACLRRVDPLARVHKEPAPRRLSRCMGESSRQEIPGRQTLAGNEIGYAIPIEA